MTDGALKNGRAIVLDAGAKLAKIIGATLAMITFVAGVFAAFYGLETSASAGQAHKMLHKRVSDVESAAETKDHAREAHERLERQINEVRASQSEALGRIEAALDKLDGRTWQIREAIKGGK